MGLIFSGPDHVMIMVSLSGLIGTAAEAGEPGCVAGATAGCEAAATRWVVGAEAGCEAGRVVSPVAGVSAPCEGLPERRGVSDLSHSNVRP
ncbi:MAG: hypothetical protein KAX78_12965, partial [Phycisphaerae bacterium]|nr:hypothetical protein [Phycisphaerae bacterium]